MNRLFRPAAVAVALVASMSFASVGHAADPLPSWNDGTGTTDAMPPLNQARSCFSMPTP